MSDCIKCGKSAADYPFRVLEVQTLHVRDLSGEKRVQALGLFQDYAICRSCAQEYLDRVRQPGKALTRKLLPFLAALAVGIIALAAGWGETALMVMGVAGILCGLVGIVSSFQTVGKRKKAYTALSPEEALRRAAWERLLEAAPRKDGDNDLTYIPVDKQTLAMKNGDLMIVYDLLPAVAKKAWNLIHGVEE